MHKKSGFTLLEIMVVLMLIGILSSLVTPNFFRKQKGVVKKQFVAEFTTLMQNTLQQAILSKKIQQVFFDIKNHTITVKSHNPSLETDDKHEQFTIDPDSLASPINIPTSFIFKNFIINDKDEVEYGRETNNAWFYVMPDGTSQPVIINFEEYDPDTADNELFSLTINPFYSQVQAHDTFQKA